MTIMLKRYLTVALALVLVFTAIPIPASAHPQKQEGILAEGYISVEDGGDYYGDYYVGGESVGWSLDEGAHLEKAYDSSDTCEDTNGTIKYYYAFGDDTSARITNIKRIFLPYAIEDVWGEYTNFKLVDSELPDAGKITKFNDSSTDTVARTGKYDADEITGHYTRWVLELNFEYTTSAFTIAHELGHVVGLNDLYDVSNVDKLMYGKESRTAQTLSQADELGAKVILGVHTSHTWGYRFYNSANGTNYHAAACTVCCGYRGSGTTLYSYAQCTYGTGSICTVCGTSR